VQLDSYQIDDQPTIAIVGLHGWSGNSKSMIPVARGVRIRSARWYLPQGPHKLNDGEGYSWYSGSESKSWDRDQAFDLLDKLLAQIEFEGFTFANTFIVGFSMGACLGLEYGLTRSYAVGGIVAIAGFIRDIDTTVKSFSESGKSTPVMLLHGFDDDIVAPDQSRMAANRLRERGNRVSMEIYEANHKIPIQKFEPLRNFIIANSPSNHQEH